MKIARPLLSAAAILGAATSLAAPNGAVAATPAHVAKTATVSVSSANIVNPVTIYEATKPSDGTALLSTNPSEITAAAANGYTQNAGAIFTASSKPQTGFVAVHKLLNPTHGYVYIPEGNEMNDAISKYGFTDKGIEFYAALSPTTGLTPVYRLSTPDAHFTYTIDKFVRDRQLTMPDWREGFAAFYVQPITATNAANLGVAVAWTYGSPQSEQDRTFSNVAATGAKWVRVGIGMDEVAIHNANGTWSYDFTKADTMVNNAMAHGLQPLVILQSLPMDFATSASGRKATDPATGPSNDAERTAFAEFAAATAKHFVDKVNNWEIWNEENLSGFWGSGPTNPDQPAPSAANYTKLLQVVYPAIHAVQPNANVILGGMGDAGASGDITSKDFLRQVYANGGKGFFDSVAAHVYGDAIHNTAEFIDQLPAYRQIMDGFGDQHKQLWVTESGDPVGKGLATQEQQAAMMMTTWNTLRALHDHGPMFNFTMDNSTPNAAETGFGMLNDDGSHRIVFTRFEQLATTPVESSYGEPSALAARQPLLWVHMGGADPTDTELKTIANRYHTVILAAQMTTLADKLRALDPSIQILAYLDLASARKWEPTQAIDSGVSFNDAEAHNWLAHDNKGNYIEWKGYPGQFQTTVWDAGYQQAWTDKAVQLATSSSFTGIFADNDMRTLGWYSDNFLEGTTNIGDSDYKMQDALRQLVNKAGSAVHAAGKTFVPNIGESRMRPGDWLRDSGHGGGFEEMWASWGHDGTPTITDTTLTNQVQNNINNFSQQNLDETPVKAGDVRTALYGYSSFLLAYKPGDAWAEDDTFNIPTLPAETSIRLGPAKASMVQDVSGALTRAFNNGWVAVNPSETKTVTLTLPAGLKKVDGTPAGNSITLQPASGVILSTK